jgi:hypothetical protein
VGGRGASPKYGETTTKPAVTPDRELVSLAADYADASAQIRRLEGDPQEAPDEMFKPLDLRRYAARDRAAELTNTTTAGLQAKASIYLGEIDLIYQRRGETTDGRDSLELLADTIARIILGGVNPSSATPRTEPSPGDTDQPADRISGVMFATDSRPDGALLHIAREYAKIHAQILVLNGLPAGLEKAMDDVLTRQHALMDVMIATPAQGPAGWRAKAEVLAIAIKEDNSTFVPEVRLAAALAKDLMQGIAPPK